MEKILLLHGAIGSREQLQPLANVLKNKYEVHTFNFEGHGGLSIPSEPFSIPFFAEQLLNYLQEQHTSKVNIFGYSMGGYVGMWIAKHHPEKINKLVTLATKFYWDPAVAENEIKFLDPEKILQKLPAFAETLQKRHVGQDWKSILDKTGTMLLELGNNNPLGLADYKTISLPCLLLLGDRDKMITTEETINVYKQLPNAEFGILPGTPHPIEQVNVEMLSFLIDQFITKS